MSIQSEINRIAGNVSDAFDAIQLKGVTVPSSATSDDLATLIGQISGGGGGAISVVDTQDSHGGIVRTITAVDISDTTAAASDVASGKYFYTADGTKTAGTASGGTVNLQAKTNISPTTSSQTIAPDSGYDGLSSVQINAMPSGTAGTPVATKGTVSNHSVSVTPSVTNTTGYITGDTKIGTAVTVTAAELESGTKSINQNGTNIDVTGYAAVDVAVSSGGANINDPILFIDYDGTLVASYTSVPSELPSVPTHTGLTNGVWNCTLDELTAQINAVGECIVGANYETSSGDTEIDILLTDDTLSVNLTLYTSNPDGSEGLVDWGDNSTPTSYTRSFSGSFSLQHTYTTAGAYTVHIKVLTYTAGLYGTNTGGFFNGGQSSSTNNRPWLGSVLNIRLGPNMGLQSYALYYCSSLASISLPPSMTAMTTIGQLAFAYTSALQAVCIPKTVGTISSSAFNYSGMQIVSMPVRTQNITINSSAFLGCRLLKKIVLSHKTGSSLGASAFSMLESMKELVIPSSVSSIGANAFSGNYNVTEYHFLSTTPPTLSATNVFNFIKRDCKIYVPSASLNTYKTTNIWSDYASYMVGE